MLDPDQDYQNALHYTVFPRKVHGTDGVHAASLIAYSRFYGKYWELNTAGPNGFPGRLNSFHRWLAP